MTETLEPVTDEVDQQQLVEGVEAVRRYLGRYEHLLGDRRDGTVSLANVRAQVDDAHRRYQAAEYQDVVELLPPLLAMVDAMSREPESTPGIAGRCC